MESNGGVEVVSIEPCRLEQEHGGRWRLVLEEFEGTRPVFQEAGLSGDGHCWRAVADVLLWQAGNGMRLINKVTYRGDRSALRVESSDRDLLVDLAVLILGARQDADALRALIKRADPDLLAGWTG